MVPIVSKNTMGARAFSYQAPLRWNQVPVQVQEADTLKSRLKTFLFDLIKRIAAQVSPEPPLSNAAIGLV